METVNLIHNPTAGDENHSKEHLVKEIEAAGFRCRYRSTKGFFQWRIDKKADLIAVAGGDGTVRKAVKQLLKKEGLAQKVPVAVLAMGTANNIAKTLNVTEDTGKIVQSWKNGRRKKIDIGEVENVRDESFFLEGMGFGIFPSLMEEMKKKEEEYGTPEEELKGALKKLQQLLVEYKPCRCQLEVDGTDYSGSFYMVEVMNIRSIGPNLVLAPFADPGDGEFEVVMVPETHHATFSEYLLHKLRDDEEPYRFPTVKGKRIRICWDGTNLHVDDKLLEQKKETDVRITIKAGALQFLVPTNEPTNG